MTKKQKQEQAAAAERFTKRHARRGLIFWLITTRAEIEYVAQELEESGQLRELLGDVKASELLHELNTAATALGDGIDYSTDPHIPHFLGGI